MTDVVLDASVVLKWFHSQGEPHAEQASALRASFEAGKLRVLAPPLLWLEVLNVAARRWGWEQARLAQLAETLPNLGFELIVANLSRVARWAAAGLTAYDAVYVAVAEQTGANVVTDDEQIVSVAPSLASPLSGWVAPEEASDMQAERAANEAVESSETEHEADLTDIAEQPPPGS